MITQWCIYLASLLGCVVFYAAYQGWLAWVLLMAAVWLPVLSLVLSLPAILTTKMTILSAGTVRQGERRWVSVRVRCPLPVPQYRCRVRFTRSLTGESWLLEPGDPMPTEHAGLLVCTAEKCRIYDYLGLFRIKARRSRETETLVRPLPVPMTVPAGLERYAARAWKPKPGGGFAENHELRLYRPGDQLNQVHWKLSAKTGKLIIREAMEPVQGTAVLTLDLQGTPAQLDRKLGKLLWMGEHLLQRELRYEIQAMTGSGVLAFSVSNQEELIRAVDTLLGCEPARETILSCPPDASWHYHIGGDEDEG